MKATANKGYVFAGWYLDEAGARPIESTVDLRTASLPYVMTAEPETMLYGVEFGVIEGDHWGEVEEAMLIIGLVRTMQFKISGVRIKNWISCLRFTMVRKRKLT